MKYRMTDETLEWYGHTLHRIEALINLEKVKAGDKGGWIEREENLSQEDNCWIHGDAKVYEWASVGGNAMIHSNAQVYGLASVHGNAMVMGYSSVYGHANVHGSARIYCSASVYDYAEVCDNAEIFDNAEVYGHANVFGHAKVNGNAKVHCAAEVSGNANIISADVTSVKDYIVFKNWWSSGRYFTWTRSNNMWCVGCFYGTGEELIAKAYEDSQESGREYERVVKYVEAILKDEEVTPSP